jgi:hypothetical protein
MPPKEQSKKIDKICPEEGMPSTQTPNTQQVTDEELANE